MGTNSTFGLMIVKGKNGHCKLVTIGVLYTTRSEMVKRMVGQFG
jgi:hypothetical protein